MVNENKKSKAPDPWKYAETATDEVAIQVAVFMWCALPDVQAKYPELKFCFSIPNGMWAQNKAIAGKYRAAGLKRGVPDICCPVKRGEYSGLWIELKLPEHKGKKKGEGSDEQQEWIAFLKEQGYGAIICYGFEETIETLQEYLNYKRQVQRDWATKAQDMQMFETRENG